MLDKRESAAAILWFCKSTKGDNLACLGWHPEGFYITQLLTAASAFFSFLKSNLQECNHQQMFAQVQDMRKVLADKMKVSPAVCCVLVTKVTIKVSIITKL